MCHFGGSGTPCSTFGARVTPFLHDLRVAVIAQTPSIWETKIADNHAPGVAGMVRDILVENTSSLLGVGV